MNYNTSNLGENDFSVRLSSNGSIDVIDHQGTYDSFESLRDIKLHDLNFERSISATMAHKTNTARTQAVLIDEETHHSADYSNVNWDAALANFDSKISQVKLSLSAVRL